MMQWTPRKALVVGLVLIAATNAVALLGVIYNRSGPPESVLEFSQRELDLPYGFMQREDSGIALQLRWRNLSTENYGPPEWLDQAKLHELGFALPPIEEANATFSRRWQTQEKPAFIVLEMNGPAYQAALERARARVGLEKAALEASPQNEQLRHKLQYAEDALRQEQEEQPRLIAVDAGRFVEPLRKRYPDTSRYLILRGTVQPAAHTRDGKLQWWGYVHDVSGTQIHVPLHFKRQLQSQANSGSHFTARVAFGQRLEPWLESLQVSTPPSGTP